MPMLQCAAADNGKCLVYEDGKLMGKISANDVVSVLESRVRARVNAENQK